MVITTYQNLRLGKYWQQLWATLNNSRFTNPSSLTFDIGTPFLSLFFFLFLCFELPLTLPVTARFGVVASLFFLFSLGRFWKPRKKIQCNNGMGFILQNVLNMVKKMLQKQLLTRTLDATHNLLILYYYTILTVLSFNCRDLTVFILILSIQPT